MTEAQLLAAIRAGNLGPDSPEYQELIAKIVARTGAEASQVSVDLDNLLRAFDEETQQSVAQRGQPDEVSGIFDAPPSPAPVPRSFPFAASAPDVSEGVPFPTSILGQLPEGFDIPGSVRGQLPPGERRGPAVSAFGDPSGRAAAFRSFRQDAFPQGLSRRGQSALQGQLNAISPFFDPQRALGTIPADTDFRDFIEANIGQRGFDPVSSARQIGGLFGQDLDEDSAAFQLRRGLIENPGRQVDLAFAAANQGFPAPFSAGLLETLRDREAKFRTSQPINPTTGLPILGSPQFLPDFLRRNSFGGR